MSAPARPNRSLQLVPAPIIPLPPVARVRRIAVVPASARQSCAVCSDGQRPVVSWIAPGSGAVLGKGGCPHCDWGMAIAYPPMHIDQPKDAS